MSDLRSVGQSVLDWWMRGGLAGSLGLKPADVQMAEAAQRPLNPFDLSSPMLGFGSPAIMGGERAAAGLTRFTESGTEPETDALSRARGMEAESGMTGATDRQIFDKTGWYRGADNKWRFVIPDQAAEFGPGIKRNYGGGEGWVGVPPLARTTLGEVLTHNDLYEAYPWLKNVEVTSVPLDLYARGVRGGSAPGFIQLGPGREAEVMRSLLHEVQHQVQGFEGFASGGTPEQFLPKGITWETATPAQKFLAFRNYKSLAGEQESYLIEEQHAQQDWSRLPQEYEGYVPKAQQIVQFRPQTNPKYQLIPVDHDPFAP